MGNKKILIIAPMRAGKDQLAEILRDKYGMTFQSSSYAAAELFIFDIMKDEHGYETVDDCFNDRHSHRDLWFKLICEYNKEDKAKLAKYIVSTSDIYVGMRDREELIECKRQGVFDIIYWVDSSKRVLHKEPLSSCTVTEDLADYTVNNNGSLKQLEYYADAIYGMVTEDLSIEERFND
jgi:hypothetical protein